MMKKNNDSVPRLDLAPQLKRPLYIWNPLDYLRLLYWVFFFPQALRWYTEKYGEGEGFAKQTTWQSKLKFVREHPNQLKLWFQGLILSVCVPYLFCRLLEKIGVTIDWGGVVIGITAGTGFGISGSIVFGVAAGVAVGIAFGVAFGIAGGVVAVMEFGVAFGVVFGVAVGVAFGVGFGVKFAVVEGVEFGAIFGVLFGAAVSVVGGLEFGVVVGVAVGVGILHPEIWLIGVPLYLISIYNRSFLIPRITAIPLPLLTNEIKFWLRKDWQVALENIDQLLRYSLQYIPVVNAVDRILAELPPEEIIYRVSQLADNPYDWKLFISTSHAVPVGFWYLYKQKPEKATAAFEKVRSLLYGQEMFLLAQTLTKFRSAVSPDAIAEIQIPNFPPEPHLRPTTWEALKGLRRVVEDTQLILKDTSRAARAFALARAIGQLKEILDNADALPQAEGGLILDIAQNWKKALESAAKDVGDIYITKPVENSYIIGDPVEGDLFVGRENIIRELEELWLMSSQLQSVVLYGHRRMGKTSILRNVAKSLGADVADVQVVYVNLQGLGAISQGMGEVFLAISDEISDAINLSPPNTDELLKLPQRNFKLYLQQAIKKLAHKPLIIALDEFETIEDLINTQQLPPNFMAVLRGFVQMDRKIAFAFAGLHTLEEMTEDYFEPFFASVIPIRVGFLNRATTRQLLANPNPDFLLTYEPEAMDRIYDLTFGQPYLVQLLGFLLVRRYNEQTFEEGKPREPIFTVADVDAILEKNELFQNGRYYFRGVWGQAGQDAPGQQDILKALAQYRGGCSRATLQQLINLDEAIMNDALDTLFRHDVIVATEGNLKFAVELFRRWVVKNQGEN
ncbi:AAA family ATPase [Dapis sp. BLCC M126]|uniref:AAA family ATPase n=1 Tax=Dapis sp. BLCC M126 TaxID=3400189 RepID=UPI003CF32AE8